MKYINTSPVPVVELTRYNLETLLEKLDNPRSFKMLSKTTDDGSASIWVAAVENEAHYADREPGEVYHP